MVAISFLYVRDVLMECWGCCFEQSLWQLYCFVAPVSTLLTTTAQSEKEEAAGSRQLRGRLSLSSSLLSPSLQVPKSS